MRRILGRILLVLTLLAVFVAAWLYWPGRTYSSAAGLLPEAHEITSVEVTTKSGDWITVPMADYEKLVTSLFPAKVDRRAKKWRSHGRLKIVANDRTWHLDMHKSHDDLGAFCIRPPSGWQTYLRCRRSDEMKTLFDNVQRAALIGAPAPSENQ